MKFEVKRNNLIVTPENEQDIAFIEDTLGLQSSGDYVCLERENIDNEVRLVTCQKTMVSDNDKPFVISEERRIGSIKSFNGEKGYGFIVDENEKDVFFHITDFVEKGTIPARGMEVSFSIGKSDHNESGIKAIDVKFDSSMPKRHNN